jgi:hypothetical protein
VPESRTLDAKISAAQTIRYRSGSGCDVVADVHDDARSSSLSGEVEEPLGDLLVEVGLAAPEVSQISAGTPLTTSVMPS